MRIASSLLLQNGLNAILDQQAKVGKTQQQLATGKKLLTPGDDPAASTKILSLGQSFEITAQYQANSEVARNRLEREESVLAQTTNLLNRVRELAVQGNNATFNNNDRAMFATEVRQRLDELLAFANTTDANGEYLFAGYQSHTPPFTPDGAGNFIYNGDEGQRFIQIGPTRQLAVGDSGMDVFRAILNGNGTFTTRDNPANQGSAVIDPGAVTDPSAFDGDIYTVTFTDPATYQVTDSAGNIVTGGTYKDGGQIAFKGISTAISGKPQAGDSFTISPSVKQDVFTTVTNLANALETVVLKPSDTTRLTNAVNRFLTDIDQSMERINQVRSRVGSRLNAIDAQRDVNDEFASQIQTALSSLQDLDYAEAATRLNQQLVGMQAAQQSFIKIQSLSLFNFL